MKAKEYLQQYLKLKSDIVFYQTMKNEVIYDLASPQSPCLSAEGGSGSLQSDPVGNLVVKIDKRMAKYDMKIIECTAKLKLMEHQILEMQNVNNDYYKILAYHYQVGMSFKEIGEKMFLSYSSVTHMHGSALQKFSEIFENKMNCL